MSKQGFLIDERSVVPIECVMAAYLYDHPDVIVVRDDTFFVFDSNAREFRARKPKNKVMNGWYRANGLHDWFEKIMRTFAQHFTCMVLTGEGT